MTCSPFDLKEYLFGELNAEQRESVDRHLLACTGLPGRTGCIERHSVGHSVHA